jgi:HD-GYP domain-containing protein (c-di-GMP phosphodiesterase class II)
MTADRIYRKGMPVEVAVERLKAGMGTQYDPKLCAIFIQFLIETGVFVPTDPDAVTGLRLIAGGRAG